MFEQLLTLIQTEEPIPVGDVIFYFDPITLTDTSNGGLGGTNTLSSGVVSTTAYKIFDKNTIRIPANNSVLNRVLAKPVDLTNMDITIEFQSKFDTISNRSAWSNIFSWNNGSDQLKGIVLRFANVGVLNERLNFYSNYDANVSGNNVYYAPSLTRDDVWNKVSTWAIVIKGNMFYLYHNGKRLMWNDQGGVPIQGIPINKALHMRSLKSILMAWYGNTAAEAMPGYMGPIMMTNVAKYTGLTYKVIPF